MFSILLCGCGKLSIKQYDSLENQYYTTIDKIIKDYYLEIQDVSQGKEISRDLYCQYNNQIHKLFKDVFALKNKVPQERISNWNNINRMANALYILNMYSMNHNDSDKQEQKIIQDYCNDILNYVVKNHIVYQ